MPCCNWIDSHKPYRSISELALAHPALTGPVLGWNNTLRVSGSTPEILSMPSCIAGASLPIGTPDPARSKFPLSWIGDRCLLYVDSSLLRTSTVPCCRRLVLGYSKLPAEYPSKGHLRLFCCITARPIRTESCTVNHWLFLASAYLRNNNKS